MCGIQNGVFAYGTVIYCILIEGESGDGRGARVGHSETVSEWALPTATPRSRLRKGRRATHGRGRLGDRAPVGSTRRDGAVCSARDLTVTRGQRHSGCVLCATAQLANSGKWEATVLSIMCAWVGIVVTSCVSTVSRSFLRVRPTRVEID